MTHKKKPPSQSKCQEITDSSGWTHVVKGPKVDAKSIGVSPFNQLQTEVKLEEYKRTFVTKYMRHWQDSECLQSLKRILEQDVLAAEHLTITTCVCLGLGSLTAGVRTPSYELAALVSMLDILSARHEIQEVIFQDPAFNATDKTFLNSLGYTVVADPEAFSKIGNHTFVFAPHLEFAQTATALEHSKPPLFIGNDLDAYVNGLYCYHAEEKKPGSCDIFQRYMEHTSVKSMPDFDRATWTNETKIYWLKDPIDDT